MEYITRIKVNGERKEISPEEASEILTKTVERALEAMYEKKVEKAG